MKQHIQEALSNLDNMIEVDAVANPVTAQLKKDIKKKYDDFKEMTETDDNYLGAKKQPVPKKVEVPKSEAKLDLSESLFEDLDSSDYNDLRSNVYNALSDIMYKYQIEKELPISKFDLDNAINWFNDNFWVEPDEEDDTDESLKEMISDSSFKAPSRIRIKADGPESYSKQRITNYLLEIINSCQFKPEILNQSEDEIIITVPGRQDWVDKLKAIDAESNESNIVTSIDESLSNRSLKEDYSEDELEQAINIVKKYYHNNLHSFLESFVFNCPIADGGEIIKDLADYIDEHDDYIDESLKESLAGKKVFITEIDWDVDKENIDLPTEVIVTTEELGIDEFENSYEASGNTYVEGQIEDWLSNKYGSLVNSYYYYIGDNPYEEDDLDESLKESRQNNINDYIRELHRTHPAFTTADEMIEYLEDNDEIEELEDSFMTDVIGAIEEYFEDLDESFAENLNEKLKFKDLFDKILNELDAVNYNRSNWSDYSLSSNERYPNENISVEGNKIKIYVSSKDDLKFAQKVAEDNNCEFKSGKSGRWRGPEHAYWGMIIVNE